MKDKKIRIVVAKYKEDLSWTRSILDPRVNLLIYDKSDDGIQKIDEYVRVNDSYFKLPNIGRESHTYIKHIVENYNNLLDIEIFVQGNPFDHVPDFLSKITFNEDIDFLDFSSWRKISCLNENSYQRISKAHPNIDINDKGSGSYIFLASEGHRKIYELVHGKIDDSSDSQFIEYGLHGMFAVSSERIKKIPISVYQKMLDLFNLDFLSSESSLCNHIYWAYEFEYLWKYIFSNRL